MFQLILYYISNYEDIWKQICFIKKEKYVMHLMECSKQWLTHKEVHQRTFQDIYILAR